jgi:hypothetical protein
MMKPLLLAFAMLSLSSCLAHKPLGPFRVLPKSPEYLLRSPDRAETPFPDVLRRYNGFEPARNSVDLRPLMELRIENAYYKKGMPKRGLNGYLGTEVAQYRVEPKGGLKQLSVRSMKERPQDQLPVQKLIPAAQRHHRYYRFYFEILFRNGEVHGSVLLGAESREALERLGVQLTTEPDSVCGAKSIHCTVFPEACSVSLEMQVVVNGVPKSVLWGSRLKSVAKQWRHVEVSRLYDGRLSPVVFDSSDPKALDLPLLPGDHIRWN